MRLSVLAEYLHRLGKRDVADVGVHHALPLEHLPDLADTHSLVPAPTEGYRRWLGVTVNILEDDNTTGLHVTDPFMGAHHEEVNVLDMILVLTKEKLTALGTVHHQDHVVVPAELDHRFQWQVP